MLARLIILWLDWWDTIQFGGLEELVGDREELLRSLWMEHREERLALRRRVAAQLLPRLMLSKLVLMQQRLILLS